MAVERSGQPGTEGGDRPMRKLIAATAVITALAVSAGTALAFQCPTLIKQGRDAAAKMDAKDEKVKKATAMLDKAEGLHKEGKHAESVAEANEALAALGVKKSSSGPRCRRSRTCRRRRASVCPRPRRFLPV